METEEKLKTNPDGRRHRRRHSYSEAMEEKNAIVEPEELTRRQSVVARWNIQNNKKKLSGEESHDSASSSLSSSPSIRRGRTRSVTRTPSSSATSGSSSLNEIELPEVFFASPRVTGRLAKSNFIGAKTMTDCACRKDSFSSASQRDSFSSYSIKRQDSGYSISTCHTTLPPSTTKNSITTLNGSQDGRLHQHQTGDTYSHSFPRRYSDQTFPPRSKNSYRRLSLVERLSDQSLMRQTLLQTITPARSTFGPSSLANLRNVQQPGTSIVKYPIDSSANQLHQDKRNVSKARVKRPSFSRRDSETSIQSSRRDSLAPVTPKMLRRRFSEQLILEGGFGNEPEFDDLVATRDENDPEESLTVANARKKVTLKRHYYPEGNWGYVVTVVAVIIHSICHGLQMGSGVLLLPVLTRFDKKLGDAGFPSNEKSYSRTSSQANESSGGKPSTATRDPRRQGTRFTSFHAICAKANVGTYLLGTYAAMYLVPPRTNEIPLSIRTCIFALSLFLLEHILPRLSQRRSKINL